MRLAAHNSLSRLLLVHWRYFGIVLGILFGLMLVGFLVFPGRSALVARGPMNTGHEELACQECHSAVQGTAAQQLSANVYYWLGLRESTIGFGSRDVDNDACTDCHQRPDDRHPVSRFLEPRFADQRKHLAAHMCVTCHTEHFGLRVTLQTTGYCVHCHQDTVLEDDPVSPSHEELVRRQAWNTCLQCHDFHGNHIRTTPVSLDEAVSESRIRNYFEGGPSPYGEEKYMESYRTRGEGRQ